MAFSAVIFPSCTPRTQSSLLCAPKPLSLLRSTPTTLMSSTSLFPALPRATQKLLYQSLRDISPGVANPKRCVGKVKASMKLPSVEVFSEEHLAVSLAHDVFQLSKKFIHERGHFSIALPTGFSVEHLRKLFEPSYIGSIDWSKWHFFWMEPIDHAESNYKLVNETFLSKVLCSPTNVSSLFSKWKVPLRPHHLNVHTIEHNLEADQAAESFKRFLGIWMSRKVVASLPNVHFPKFDLMLLGLDPDGHVPSRFPATPPPPPAPNENANEEWVTLVNDAENPRRQRITFTLPVITSSSNIAVVVAGATEANAVDSALRDDQEGETLKMSSAEGEVKWYLDKGAASKLFKDEIHMEKGY